MDLTGPQSFTVEILDEAISTLNETNIAFDVRQGEAAATVDYTFTGPNGGTVTGTNTMELDEITITGEDLSNLSDGEITLSVTLTDQYGNVGATATDRVVKDTEEDIPEGFSPNGDGIDDNWVIPGIEDFPNNVVTIFNRYGTKVFEIEGYDNQDNAWDSQANVDNIFGSAGLPDGTYFYVIEFPNSTMESRSGFVILKR